MTQISWSDSVSATNFIIPLAGAEEQILTEYRATTAEPEKMLKAMVQSSGKLVLIDKLLPKLKAGNHKVLVFSQMIRVLDILEDYLITNQWVECGGFQLWNDGHMLCCHFDGFVQEGNKYSAVLHYL